MSFNRYEQLLHDYIEDNPEEKRYWTALALEFGRSSGRRESIALEFNALLWEYFEERALHEPPLKDIVATEGAEKISMLNLSEYWLRMHAPVSPPKAKR